MRFGAAGASRAIRRARQLLRSPQYRSDVARSLLSAIVDEARSAGRRRLRYLWSRVTRSSRSYEAWIKLYDDLTPVDIEQIRTHLKQMDRSVRISIVMPVFNAPERYLRRAIDSVRAQLYENWELCIADDCSTAPHVRTLLDDYCRRDRRIKVIFRGKNGHISAASNSALGLATGAYIALLDQDDEIPPHALYLVVHAIAGHPEADIVYTDEDKIDAGGARYAPYFKCDWNEGLFLSHNVISHLGVYRAELVKQAGGFREGYEGSQDYDLALRCLDASETPRIIHVPFVLYHWRATPESAALTASAKPYAHAAARSALNDHFQRRHYTGRVIEGAAPGLHRATFDLPEPPPRVSIIVLTSGRDRTMVRCVESVLSLTRYPDYEIILVDGPTEDARKRPEARKIVGDPRVRWKSFDGPSTYSALNNYGVRQSTGSVICLLDNATEVIAPAWLEEMVGHACRPSIGAVGAKLLYSDRTVRHAGLVLGMNAVAGSIHRLLGARAPGYFGRAIVGQELSAVSSACLAVRRDVYEQAGGFDEEHLAAVFADVDFCLRVRAAGFRNYWSPYALLYHHEAKSQRYGGSPWSSTDVANEARYVQSRWRKWLDADPAYSPNLTLETDDYSPAFPPRVVKPWVPRVGSDDAPSETIRADRENQRG